MDNVGFGRARVSLANQGAVGGNIEPISPGGPGLEECFVSIPLHVIDRDTCLGDEAPDGSSPRTGIHGLVDFNDLPIVGLAELQISGTGVEAAFQGTTGQRQRVGVGPQIHTVPVGKVARCPFQPSIT